MKFSDILDEIARPQHPEEDAAAFARAGLSPEFRTLLDALGAASPVPAAAVRQAYGQDTDGRHRARAVDPAVTASDLSIDPDDILFELDLDEVASLEGLSVLRRRFARLNHPDRMRLELRERANVRMTIANALIDAAAARLSG